MDDETTRKISKTEHYRQQHEAIYSTEYSIQNAFGFDDDIESDSDDILSRTGSTLTPVRKETTIVLGKKEKNKTKSSEFNIGNAFGFDEGDSDDILNRTGSTLTPVRKESTIVLGQKEKNKTKSSEFNIGNAFGFDESDSDDILNRTDSTLTPVRRESTKIKLRQNEINKVKLSKFNISNAFGFDDDIESESNISDKTKSTLTLARKKFTITKNQKTKLTDIQKHKSKSSEPNACNAFEVNKTHENENSEENRSSITFDKQFIQNCMMSNTDQQTSSISIDKHVPSVRKVTTSGTFVIDNEDENTEESTTLHRISTQSIDENTISILTSIIALNTEYDLSKNTNDKSSIFRSSPSRKSIAEFNKTQTTPSRFNISNAFGFDSSDTEDNDNVTIEKTFPLTPNRSLAQCINKLKNTKNKTNEHKIVLTTKVDTVTKFSSFDESENNVFQVLTPPRRAQFIPANIKRNNNRKKEMTQRKTIRTPESNTENAYGFDDTGNDVSSTPNRKQSTKKSTPLYRKRNRVKHDTFVKKQKENKAELLEINHSTNDRDDFQLESCFTLDKRRLSLTNKQKKTSEKNMKTLNFNITQSRYRESTNIDCQTPIRNQTNISTSLRRIKPKSPIPISNSDSVTPSQKKSKSFEFNIHNAFGFDEESITPIKGDQIELNTDTTRQSPRTSTPISSDNESPIRTCISPTSKTTKVTLNTNKRSQNNIIDQTQPLSNQQKTCKSIPNKGVQQTTKSAAVEITSSSNVSNTTGRTTIKKSTKSIFQRSIKKRPSKIIHGLAKSMFQNEQDNTLSTISEVPSESSEEEITSTKLETSNKSTRKFFKQTRPRNLVSDTNTIKKRNKRQEDSIDETIQDELSSYDLFGNTCANSYTKSRKPRRKRNVNNNGENRTNLIGGRKNREEMREKEEFEKWVTETNAEHALVEAFQLKVEFCSDSEEVPIEKIKWRF